MRFMIWEAWLTLVVVGLCVALLASNRYPADIVMLSGVLTPEEALSGLANEGMVTVAVLYVVVPESFPLLGKSIREGRFRTLYQTASIAVARNGERIQRKTGVLTVLIAPLVWPFRVRLPHRIGTKLFVLLGGSARPSSPPLIHLGA